MPGRIFISYSKQEPEPTRQLAALLAQHGYSVWWDTNLTAGEVFREVIDREIEAADAVIVVWTKSSIASNWVIAEADHASRLGRLITLRTGDIEPWRIPKPFNTLHAEVVDDRAAVLAAVTRLAGKAVDANEIDRLASQYWHTLSVSNDAAALRQFLAQFGSTRFAPLAANRLRKLAIANWHHVDQSNPASVRQFAAAWPEVMESPTPMSSWAPSQPAAGFADAQKPRSIPPASEFGPIEVGEKAASIRPAVKARSLPLGLWLAVTLIGTAAAVGVALFLVPATRDYMDEIILLGPVPDASVPPCPQGTTALPDGNCAAIPQNRKFQTLRKVATFELGEAFSDTPIAINPVRPELIYLKKLNAHDHDRAKFLYGILDLESGRRRPEVSVHAKNSWTNNIAVSTDGEQIFALDNSFSTVEIYKRGSFAETGQLTAKLAKVNGSNGWQMVFNQRAMKILSTARCQRRDGLGLQLWSLSPQGCKQIVKFSNDDRPYFNTLSASPDFKYAAYVINLRKLAIVAVQDESTIASLDLVESRESYRPELNWVRFMLGGDRIVACARGAGVTMLYEVDARNGAVLNRNARSTYTSCVGEVVDSDNVVSASDGELSVVDIHTAKTVYSEKSAGTNVVVDHVRSRLYVFRRVPTPELEKKGLDGGNGFIDVYQIYWDSERRFHRL